MNKLFWSRLRNIFRVGYFKTVYINLKLLPFKQAIKFPIVVTRATTIGSLSGKVILKCPVKTGLIRFGFLHSDLMSWSSMKTFINIQGDFIVNGWMQFGVGFNISIDDNSILEIGSNSCFGSLGKIICRNKITIDKNFRAGWEVQIFDTNFHYTKDVETGVVYSRIKSTYIGKNNWIGFRSSVMQGTITPDYFIVASNSICNKDYTKFIPRYSLVAGAPVKLLKNNIIRVLDNEEKEIQEMFDKTTESFLIVDKAIREI